MSEPTLRDSRIVVVEDDYVPADDLTTELAGSLAIVVGPIAPLRGAPALLDKSALLDKKQRLDAAILDVNLCGEVVCAVADRLVDRSVLFLRSTSYGVSVIPPVFRKSRDATSLLISNESPLQSGGGSPLIEMNPVLATYSRRFKPIGAVAI